MRAEMDFVELSSHGASRTQHTPAPDRPGRSTRTPLDPRERRVTHKNVPLADDLDGYPAISRTGAPACGPGGARAGPARSNGVSARSTTAIRAGVRAGVDVMDLAEAGNRPPHRARGVASCPNLPQRPGSSRNTGRESLIFRAFLRDRSRRGAPLWQIWTRPRPGPPQEPHQHHHAPAHPSCRADSDLRTRTHGPPFPARKAQCELSSTKSTSARTMRAQLA